MPTKGEKGDGDKRYREIERLLEMLKAQIAATDRKVTALEKAEDRATARIAAALERAERAKKAEAADVTKPNNEAEVAEGASNGRERSNNQPISAKATRPELQSAKNSRTGPGPAELEGDGWYDSEIGERGRWPRLRKTEWRQRALRRGGTREREWKIYEFPVGTERGQFQLWINGNYAEDVTAEMIAAKGNLMAFESRDLMDEFEEEGD
jgi:hypothetical protein